MADDKTTEEVTPTEAAPEETQVVFPEHGSEVENEHGTEVIVHDTDEDGNVIGWHKELKGEK